MQIKRTTKIYSKRPNQENCPPKQLVKLNPIFTESNYWTGRMEEQSLKDVEMMKIGGN